MTGNMKNIISHPLYLRDWLQLIRNAWQHELAYIGNDEKNKLSEREMKRDKKGEMKGKIEKRKKLNDKDGPAEQRVKETNKFIPLVTWCQF